MTKNDEMRKRALRDFLNSAEKMAHAHPITRLSRNLPPEWAEIDLHADVEPEKEKITLRLDRDVIKFFKAEGRGYTKQINYVLRTFAMGRISNAIFVRDQALDVVELVEKYHVMPTEELTQLTALKVKLARREAELREELRAME